MVPNGSSTLVQISGVPAMQRLLVVLVGNSLLMDSIEASLSDDPTLDITRIFTPPDETASFLLSIGPDVILFDWDTPHRCCVLPFLRHQPAIPVLGVDINTNQVVALSSQHYAVSTANRLSGIIREQTTGHHWQVNEYSLAFVDAIHHLFQSHSDLIMTG